MRHEFAFFTPQLATMLKSADSLGRMVVADESLTHRLQHVVRLEVGGQCVFFDNDHHALVALHEYRNKKTCLVSVIEHAANTVIRPHITALLPILKREAFEQACYNLVELGVTVIQPVVTSKIQRAWGGAKERERLHKIMIAAAEQSKHYAGVQLNEPCSFEQALSYKADILLYADPAGMPLWDAAQTLRTRSFGHCAIMIGPEGDLAPQELQQVIQAGFMRVALTPTILRSYQAITLMVGAVRALVNHP